MLRLKTAYGWPSISKKRKKLGKSKACKSNIELTVEENEKRRVILLLLTEQTTLFSRERLNDKKSKRKGL